MSTIRPGLRLRSIGLGRARRQILRTLDARVSHDLLMLSLNLGPLALPVGPLLWLAVTWVTHAMAVRLAGGDDPEATRRVAAGKAVWRAAITGFAVARLAFVAASSPAYLASPVLILDLRDGGWMPVPGVAAALAVLAGHAWRCVPLRRPLAAAAAVGAVLWGVASTLLGLHERLSLPQLTLADLDGRPIDLSEAVRGKPAVINLWATWCPPCIAELPLLAQAQRTRPGVHVVFVNQGETADVVRGFLDDKGLALANVLLDDGRRMGPAIGSSGLPTTIFVDARGSVVARHVGLLSSASLAAGIDALR